MIGDRNHIVKKKKIQLCDPSYFKALGVYQLTTVIFLVIEESLLILTVKNSGPPFLMCYCLPLSLPHHLESKTKS